MNVEDIAQMTKLEERAEKAEADRNGYKNQIKAVDNILETYEANGPLPHDRVLGLIQRFETRIEELEELARKRSDTIVKLLQRAKELEAALELRRNYVKI